MDREAGPQRGVEPDVHPTLPALQEGTAIDTRVAAVMTVYNRRDLTLACLGSLRAQQVPGVRIDTFVVDDASTDGTAEAIQEEHPDTVLLRGDGNLFWNGGMRRAFGAALERGYDHYLWMNDDVELDDGAVRRLLATYEELGRRGHEAAIVVGSMRHPETGALTYGGVVRPSRLRPLQFRLVPPSDEPRPTDTMNGNCVLVPRAVTDKIGNIDPAYRQKLGDFDYGLRARAAGCSVFVAPGTFGTCATHPPRTATATLGEEFRRLYSIKELPPRPWATFTRRWSGPLWPLYWLSPYLRRGMSLCTERARLALAASRAAR